MLHFPKFRPRYAEHSRCQGEPAMAGQTPRRQLGTKMNPGLNPHSRSRIEMVRATTFLFAAAEARPPMPLASGE